MVILSDKEAEELGLNEGFLGRLGAKIADKAQSAIAKGRAENEYINSDEGKAARDKIEAAKTAKKNGDYDKSYTALKVLVDKILKLEASDEDIKQIGQLYAETKNKKAAEDVKAAKTNYKQEIKNAGNIPANQPPANQPKASEELDKSIKTEKKDKKSCFNY